MNCSRSARASQRENKIQLKNHCNWNFASVRPNKYNQFESCIILAERKINFRCVFFCKIYSHRNDINSSVNSIFVLQIKKKVENEETKKNEQITYRRSKIVLTQIENNLFDFFYFSILIARFQIISCALAIPLELSICVRYVFYLIQFDRCPDLFIYLVKFLFFYINFRRRERSLCHRP